MLLDLSVAYDPRKAFFPDVLSFHIFPDISLTSLDGHYWS